MTIYFYSKTNDYYEFSNFSPHGIEVDGLWWPTVEHYFQAQKFTDLEYQEKIRRAHRPKQAFELGRSRAVPLREDWGDIKDEVMFQANMIKFRTHKKLASLLLSTGEQEIVENAPGDYYWGCGKDGSGLNRLGQILMRVRQEIRASPL